MSDERPLDLRALADVESPEVVHEALARFRRRALTRYVWIALLAVLVPLGLWAHGRPSDLKEEIDAAGRVSMPGHVWRLDGVSVALDEVADLGDSVGIHLIVIPDDRGVPGAIAISRATETMPSGDFDTYARLPKGTVGTFTVTIGRAACVPHCDREQRLVIDLSSLPIPADIWRTSP
jgi:hypothetical protein